MAKLPQSQKNAFKKSTLGFTLFAIGLLLGMVLQAGNLYAGDTSSSSSASPLDGLKFNVLGYFDYSNGKSPLDSNSSKSYNLFKLTRGYLTTTKQLNAWMSVRSTLDLTQDDKGDYKIRQKYLYANLKPKDIGPLTGMNMEIGMGHIPWLDFEEHINIYRCQGTMPIERAGVLNSADLGVSVYGGLGGKLEDAAKKTGNSGYDGLYGSWHVGIFNGSGYHATEANENKVGEMRFTIRPLPFQIPGLQLSYFGLFGKGNVDSNPDYNVNMGMLSFEHPVITVTGQYFMTDGNAKGTWINPDTSSAKALKDKVLKTEGYSIFGNFRIPETDSRLSLFGRYDHFDIDKDDIIADKTAYDMVIGGIAYDLFKGNMILLTYEMMDYEKDAGEKGKLPKKDNKLGDDNKIQMVYQIKF
jgi:hypothetical protein